MRIIGTRLAGGLQVLRELDRGVSARVYLASDGRRLAALKLFRVEDAWRAARELEIGRGLDHPHLNPVDEAVTVTGRPGLLMPLVLGVRYTRWADKGADLSQRLAALAAAAEGLGYLHDRGVVHRDVKPENLLVDARGHAKLLDFDLSARVGEPPGASPPVAGTIAYLSPEQARGAPATPASDVYGLGAVTYRALTGQAPFTGDVAEVLRSHAALEPLPPSALDRRLAPFDELVACLLAKDQAARPSAAEAAEKLRAASRMIASVKPS